MWVGGLGEENAHATLCNRGTPAVQLLCPYCPGAVEFSTEVLALRHAELLHSGGGMAACSSALPSVLTLVLSILLLLQLLVSLIVLRDSSAPDFTVISISSHESGSLDSGAGGRTDSASELWPNEETAARLRAYADENELNSGQLNCSRWQGSGESGFAYVGEGSATLCLDYWNADSPCVVYSFSLDGKDAALLESTLRMKCEVHRFDPSTGHKHGSGFGYGSVRHHQAWLDWRRPHARPYRGVLGTIQHSLVDIMDSLGHSMVHVLWADLESAEWRVLESWAQDGTLRRISQLILTVHLQWAGFEVGGTEAGVVRFWYSVLSALHSSGFRLTRSTPGPGHTVLRQEHPNTHSSYKLTWIRRGEQFK
ncbi:methyltransferase-like protein 24 [Silurus meridionalis]|nr:methyltransferase-like protein 24 [Silurus meridionalis]